MPRRRVTRRILVVAIVVALVATATAWLLPPGEPPQLRLGEVPEGYQMDDLAQPGEQVQLGARGPARIGGTVQGLDVELVDVVVRGGGEEVHATIDRTVSPPVWWVLAAPPEGGEATFSITAVGADGSTSEQTMTLDFVLPDEDDVVISPDVVVLGEEGAPDLVSWSSGDGSAELRGAEPGQVRQNTILVSGVAPGVAEAGLMRRVVGLSGDAELLQVRTEAVSLDEAILQARLVEPPTGGRGRSMAARTFASPDFDLGFGVGIPEGVAADDALDQLGRCSTCLVDKPVTVKRATSESDGSGRTLSSTVELGVSASAGIGMDVDIRWEWDWFKSGFRGHFAVGLTLDGAIASRITMGTPLARGEVDPTVALDDAKAARLLKFKGEKQVFSRAFTPVTVPVMGVPVVLVPEVRVTADWTGEMTANTAVGAAGNFTLRTGFEWDEGRMDLTGEGEGDGDLRYDLRLVGKAAVTMKVAASVQAYDSFGPQISTSLAGRVSASLSGGSGPAAIDARFDVPVTVKAGVLGEVPIVGKKLFEGERTLLEKQLISIKVSKRFDQEDTGPSAGVPPPDDSAPEGLDPVTGSDLSLVVLVDTSGSMSEDDGNGTVKLDGAKVAMRQFVRTLPQGTRVGLRSYPAPGDSCGEGLRQQPVGELDADALSAQINALQASGETPTAVALAAAFDDLPRTGKRSVVLVSDGLSNCGGDPCEVANQVRENGVEVTVNAVGFRISDEGAEELRCIADATGGSFSTVEDSDSLAEALAELAGPVLTVQLSAPETVELDANGVPTEPPVVTAVVKNAGGRHARDVVVSLAASDDSAAVVDPGRPIGTIEPGASREVRWDVTPRPTGRNHDVTFEARAELLGADPEDTAQDTITIGVLSEPGDRVDVVGPVLRHASRVAILGDSFSAGEGTRQYLEGTDTGGAKRPPRNACHRSQATYGGSTSDSGSAFPHRVVLACSGAIVSDITNADPDHTRTDGDGVLPSQVEQLDDVSGPLDAVLLTIGGNDVRFSEIARNCVLGSGCSFPATVCVSVGDGDESCVEQATAAELFEGGLEGLPGRLKEAYRAIDQRLNSGSRRGEREGRQAPIVVLAYPKLLPTAPNRQSSCVLGLSPDEVRMANRIVERLNDAVRDAVEQARVEGLPVYFARSVENAFQADPATGASSRTICDPNPLANNLTPDGLGVSVESLHPNAHGYRAMTDRLLSDARRWEVLPDRRRVPGNVSVTRYSRAEAAPIGESLPAGGAATATGSGFAPGATVTAQLASTPITVGSSTADGTGDVDVLVVVPAWVEHGTHTLRLIGLDAEGNVRVVERTLEVGSQRWSRWWGVAGVNAALAGVGIVLLARRRRSAANSSEEPATLEQP